MACPCKACFGRATELSLRAELSAADARIAELEKRIAELEKQLADRQVGVVPTPETTSGVLHPPYKSGF